MELCTHGINNSDTHHPSVMPILKAEVTVEAAQDGANGAPTNRDINNVFQEDGGGKGENI